MRRPFKDASWFSKKAHIKKALECFKIENTKTVDNHVEGHNLSVDLFS